MISRLAAAKVNLDLLVTARRDDGYHELDSLVVFSSVGDYLTFEPAEALELRLDGPYAGSLENDGPPSNLVLRAAEMLRSYNGQPELGARITLTKNLPVASGLGGGSADAAASLSGLAELWNLEIAASSLAGIGLKLGADVPVCLQGRSCYLRGIGEKISPLRTMPRAWLVLVNPRKALATPQVFAAFDGCCSPAREAEKTGPMEGFADLDALLVGLKESRNDLERPAVMLVPEIADCLTVLSAEAGCLLARMSGSGASCFGLFATEDDASQAAKAITACRPGWWVAAGSIGGAAQRG